MITIVTSNELGKFFIHNNTNYTRELTTLYYCESSKTNRVELLNGKDILDVPEQYFLDHYESAIDFIPKGTICECTLYSELKILLYSGGNGTYYINKQGKNLLGPYCIHADIKLIKILE